VSRKKSRPRGTVELPRGVHRVVARGREYFYFQAGRGTSAAGIRTPLPKDPHTPEFWNALRKAQGVLSTTVVTLGAVLDLYLVSPQFEGLADGSRRQYRRSIEAARSAWGAQAATALRPVHVRDLLDGLAGKPGVANNILGFLRALSAWGLERGHFEQSITEGVKPYKSSGGHKPWTAEQCAAAEKHFTGNIRRAYFLARYTGQRGSDIVRMGFTDIEDGCFCIKPKKTGKKIGDIWLPIEAALAAEIATWQKRPGPFVPLPKRTFEDHFAKARDQVSELAGTTFHGLRATRVVELRLQGHSTAKIADAVGMSLQMIERYCRFADRKANARALVVDIAAARKKNAEL
jgi:integrase